MPDAIVLGGGGSKGAFAVGALIRLYEAGIRPSMICGASAGSINALKLAEAPQDSAQPMRIRDLWLRLRASHDMYTMRGWMAALDSSQQDLVMNAFTDIVGGLVFPLGIPGLIELGLDLQTLANAIQTGMNDSAIYDLTPIRDRLREGVNEAAVSASGTDLYLAVTDMNSGDLRFVDKRRGVRDRSLAPMSSVPNASTLVDAAVASSSIPIFFPPSAITAGGDLYQDGGIRANIPVQTAVRAGATRVFAVLLTPHPLPSMGAPNIPNEAARLPDVMMDEMVVQQLQVPSGVTATVIGPLQPMHDGLSVDPGLFAIDIDYGYMRAADVLSGASSTVVSITEQLIALRYQILEQERQAASPMPDASPNIGSAMNVRQLKQQIATLAANRRDSGGVMPPGVANWWTQWEPHSWTPLYPTPWSAYSFIGGANMPAGVAPAAWGLPAWPGPGAGALYVRQTVPWTITAGATYPVSITMQNSGGATWVPTGPAPYQLGVVPVTSTTWNTPPQNLPAYPPQVTTGYQTTFNFNITAPATPGAYRFQCSMLHGGVPFGGASPDTLILVGAATGGTTPPPPSGGSTSGTGSTGSTSGTGSTVSGSAFPHMAAGIGGTLV